MHKLILLPAAFILFFSSMVFSQPEMWQLKFGGSGFDEANGIAQTIDEGYILTGALYNSVTGSDLLLLKLSPDGTVQWSRNYGGTGIDIGNDVIQTTDSGYLVVGYTTSFGAGQNDIYVVRTNSQGDTLWTKTYGDVGDDYGNSVVINSNGEYTITGMVQYSTAKAAVLVIDDAGTLKHQAYVDAPGGASPNYKGTVLDNGRIGISHLFNTVFAITDSLGVYQQAYNYSYNGPSIDAVYTSNQQVAILVYADVGGGEKFAIHKTDLAGVKTWGWKYGQSANDIVPVSVLEAPDLGYTMLGSSIAISTGLGTITLLHVDSAGTIMWAKNYSLNSASDHIASRVIRTADNGYAIAAYSSAPGSFTDYDLYIIKTDSAGNSGCNEQSVTITRGIFSDFPPIPVSAYTGSLTNPGLPSSSSVSSPGLATDILCTTMGLDESINKFKFEIFPNPTEGSANLTYSLNENSHILIELYNSFGNLTQTLENKNQTAGQYHLTLNFEKENISAGVYFVRMNVNGLIYSGGRLVFF